MPSAVLNGQVPFYFLYPTKNSFFMDPRVFGCTCFVQDLSHGLDKLSPRSIKCVFVGYSQTQKEYRCYSPHNKKYFVSVDVIFFESVPYFSPQSPVTTSESIPLPPSVHLPPPASVYDVSSPVSLEDTTTPPAPKPPPKKISDISTLISKKFLPLN